ncbi:unnamed protein product, partial [Oppiella nova]
MAIYYMYLVRDFDYWSKQGIVGPKPIPIFGNFLETFLVPLHETELKWHQRYGKVYGHFMGKLPILNIADPELIKAILVRDFHQFHDRTKLWLSNNNIMVRNVHQLTGDDWKRVRSIVTPVFTATKLRQMEPRVRDCLRDVCDHLLDDCARSGRTIDTFAVFAKYSMDVIASSVFATKINAYESSGERENPFVTNARLMFNGAPLKELATVVLPRVVQKWLRLSQTTASMFFIRCVRHMISVRRQTPTHKYNDFIQLLMEAERADTCPPRDEYDVNDAHHMNEGEEELAVDQKAFDIRVADKQLSEDEVVAQAILFLLAGYVATAAALAYSTYELALNPHIQQRLYDEIMEASADGEPTYDRLAALPYMDAVLSETLRRYSPAVPLARVALVDYKLGDTGVTIKAGQQIEIPMYAIQHSPHFYPN